VRGGVHREIDLALKEEPDEREREREEEIKRRLLTFYYFSSLF
jgi:hypothetical protein